VGVGGWGGGGGGGGGGGVRAKSNFWVGGWVSFRAGLQQGLLRNSQFVLGFELYSYFVRKIICGVLY